MSGLIQERIMSSQETLELIVLFLLVYLVLDAIILTWFLSTPLFAGSGNRILFGLAMLGYNIGYLTTNCHQMPQRSIILSGYQIPFCARDTGVYIGCLIGAILPLVNVKTPKFMKSLLFCILLLTPLIADGVTQTIMGLRESNNIVRLATGLLFGFSLVYYFAVKVVEHTRGRVDIRAESVSAARIGAAMITILLAAAYITADDYKTLGEAVAESVLTPTFTTYVSARSMQTMTHDPYLESYDDAVLDELRLYGSRGHGVWVIYEGQTVKEGKHVYFSGGDGRFALISDVSSI